MAHDEAAGSFRGYAGSIEGAELGAQRHATQSDYANQTRRVGRLERIAQAQVHVHKITCELTARVAALAHRLGGPQKEVAGAGPSDGGATPPADLDLARTLEVGVERIAHALAVLSGQIARLEEL